MTEAATIRQQFALVDVAARYLELVKRGGEYTALCPFHDDRNPSFSIYVGRDGVQRYVCFSCGAAGDVIDFTQEIEGVDFSAACRKLTGGELPQSGTRKPPPPRPTEAPLWEPIVPVPDDAPEYNPKQTYNPKAGKMRTYNPTRVDPYYDAKGRLMFYVVRLDFPDRKITPMVTYCKGPQGRTLWAAKYIEPPFPLCGLDQLAKRPNDSVMIVSGEKCYHYALKHLPSMVPVTWPGGDDGLARTDISPLRGRYVCFWPDADWQGANAMMGLYNRLQQF